VSATAPAATRLLSASPTVETYAAHTARLGPLPNGAGLTAELHRAGLTGHGGAAFPVAVKWGAVATRVSREEPAVVVANGAETEPASLKDRTLLALRPHLVLDGLQLAARAVGANRAVLYVSRAHDALARTLSAAIGERARAGELPVELVLAPTRYVAGEETALVARLNGRAARPRSVPPRPYEIGVSGRPTLVNNVETLAHVALIARFGADWFRSAGTPDSPGTTLITVSGAVLRPGVQEIAYGTRVGDVVASAGGPTAQPAALLVGGYFGRWITAERAWALAVEPRSLRSAGLSLGAGVIAVLPKDRCGVTESDRVLAFLARESAGQCGPCSVGLPALAETFHEVAMGMAGPPALDRLARWSLEIRGRGACRHPDGATLFAASALEVFADELRRHQRQGPCRASTEPPLLPTPVLPAGWR
jgi:NADH:ubiquinone oxidoreductase subunit F (NADH-binding)